MWFALGMTGMALGLLSAPARADTPPSVTLVGASPLSVHLKEGNGSSYRATFNVNIDNAGDLVAAGSYRLSITSDRVFAAPGVASTDATTPEAPSLVVCPQTAPPDCVTPGANPPLSARAVTAVPVELTVFDDDTTSLTLVVAFSSASGVPPTAGATPSSPATQSLTLDRSEQSGDFEAIGLASVLSGAVVLLLLFVLPLRRYGNTGAPGQSRVQRLTATIWTPSSFTFSGSWLTSLSAVLTAVGTLFTTTGVLAGLVPGINTSFFLATTVGYGVVLTLPALVYSACMHKPAGSHDGIAYGTRGGYVAAASITAVAISGQLSTVGAIIWLSGLSHTPKVWIEVFLGLIAAINLLYIVANGYQLAALAPPATTPAPTPPIVVVEGTDVLVKMGIESGPTAAPLRANAPVSGMAAARSLLLPPGLP